MASLFLLLRRLRPSNLLPFSSTVILVIALSKVFHITKSTNALFVINNKRDQ